MTTHDRVAAEIVALHADFEAWFRGSDAISFDRFERSLAADFRFVPPNGEPVARSDLLDGLRRSFGENPIAIRIERPVVHWERDGAILATYEEWHDHADYSTARSSTVLFTHDASAPSGLVWRHVHETWIKPPPG